MRKCRLHWTLCAFGILTLAGLMIGPWIVAVSTADESLPLSIGAGLSDRFTRISGTDISRSNRIADNQINTKSGIAKGGAVSKVDITSGTWSVIGNVKGDVSSLAIAPDGTLLIT